MSTSTIIYRCSKKCEAQHGKNAHRVTFDIVLHKSFPDKFGYQKTTSIDYTSPAGEIFRNYLPHQIPYVSCPLCSRPMAGKRITGIVNTSVPCDRRCTGATGHNCECSCGGANHGIDHQASL